MTPGVNSAIAELHEASVLTSATLMANGPAFADAVAITKQLPGLDVGCHVTLVNGAPVSASSDVPSLLERPNAAAFRDSLGRFGMALYAGAISEQELEREMVAQIRKLQDAGVRVTHLDTHKHTHMFPRVLRPLVRAARATGVPAIRNPFELSALRARVGLAPGLHGASTPLKRGLQVGILSAMRGTFQKIVRNAAIQTPDGAVGVIVTGARHYAARLREIRDRLPDGTWELVCHPGYMDSQLASAKTILRASRQEEMSALLTELHADRLSTCGITLADFEDLNPSAVPRIKRVHATT